MEPPIILVTVAGRLTLSAVQGSRDFGTVVSSLGGKPYRVLCDFTQTVTMPEDVCAVITRGQELALERGMERDAFACTSSVLRLQFVRIARESGRFDRLGPLQFFDTVEQARAYLEVPASQTYEVASSRRLLEQGRGPTSRRAPAPDADAAPSRRFLLPELDVAALSRRVPAQVDIGEGAPSRRLTLPEHGGGVPSRRAPAPVDMGEGTPSRRPPPFSLRAAAPSRPHNKG